MGDTISAEQKEDFMKKVQFFQRMDNTHFGAIDIFRLQEPPYQYIMLYEKKFIPGDPRFSKYRQSIKTIQQKDHKNLSKIHAIEEKQEVHMCIKDKKIDIFCTYYNFTIRNAIDKKKIKESKFTETELVYAMWCLLDLAIYLKSFGISYGDYRSENVFLSPEGYVKLYLLEIQQNNKHSALYQALSNFSDINKLILSPQQLSYIADMKNQNSIDCFKSDVFQIAMVIVQMLTLDQVKFYYNQQKTAYKMGRINFQLSSMNLEYSSEFLGILRKCLVQNPQERYSFQEAFGYIDGLRKNSANVSYCIRLNQEEESSKKRKPLTSVKGQFILSGIQKRLAPVPIKSMANSVIQVNQNSRPSK